MKIIILIFTLMGLGACDKNIVPHNVREKIAYINRTFKDGNVKKESRALVAAINTISNNTVKIACYNRWIDELMSVDVSDMNYRRQGDAFDDMYNLIEDDILAIIRKSGVPLAMVWEVRIRLLEWMRKELNRIKPSGPLPNGIEWTGHGLNVQDLRVDKEFSDWRRRFKRNATRYERYIQRLEGQWFEFETRHCSAKEKEAIRDLLRKFIRRPIRSEQELLRDFKERRAMEFPYDDIPRNMGPAKFRMPK